MIQAKRETDRENSLLKAVILAAGEGRRMKPLTFTRPKPMITVANKPILEWLLLECIAAGITEFAFIIGYREGSIRDYFGDGTRWKVRISYFIQAEATGTASAIKLAQGMVGDRFIVLNGDGIIGKADIERLASFPSTSIAVQEVNDTTGLGIIEVENGRVKSILEKPEYATSKLANAGTYLFTEAIFQAIDRTEKSPRGQFEITRSLEILINDGSGVACQPINYWLTVSYPWELLRVNEIILSGMESGCEGAIEPGAHIEGRCVLGKNTRIRSGSYITGPVIIGENCDIGPNCYIRGSTAIGNGCRIGASVEIKNSIIMSGTKIPHLSYVGDSVIGENCNFGAGTKVANLRFDHRNIRSGHVDTGLHKFGAIIGDNVQTGINVSINPGTLIGDGALIRPGSVVSGEVERGSLVR
ncbi:bifunctional sugar-1-phosphate nucleotidylyltransferase/acetyltransferase [Dehalogenimonas etheniformans]|uniref:Glucose-1-phosphate thymidylyltransferase n=1 Tax=Dehalogenimonas etheniformans TaxID=1536648 RepID=A0A2P5P8W7_9CHLR|nr:bifunctional sugar-1-phosphate nucleotidylyltransferase/acetyltransferase [Dehalogenimonas etheniformans]PPD58741.1 glucose-1-phosphate thymidylyltransferase [Dehalogenimonas etheniformans]QNT76490.1 NTP transferase domain-containing protein [Dehalogenimonas etheniformans]